MKNEKHIKIGIESPEEGLKRFINAWEQAQSNSQNNCETHLNFEDLTTLLSVLTPRRLDLLKTLRPMGSTSVRKLAGVLARDYKNVHADVRALENAGLIERDSHQAIHAPWDVIEASLRLVA